LERGNRILKIDNKKITDEAREKISELSKKQNEIYLPLLSELNIEEDNHLFDYCFSDCDFDFEILNKND